VHRILIVYDGEGWAYHRRAKALQKYAPDDFDVAICSSPGMQWIEVHKYDLLFLLDYTATRNYRDHINAHSPRTILACSHNRDYQTRFEYLIQSVAIADYAIVNNQSCWEHAGRIRKSCNISNGVDHELWYPTNDPAARPLRAIWCGSGTKQKGKGYKEILVPLQGELARMGVECDFRAINDLNEDVYGDGKQRAWYNSASIVVCSSMYDATPNYLLEAMACGCIPVTTFVGNVKEFGRHWGNCVICDWSVDSLAAGVRTAMRKRATLSAGAIQAMKSWGYDSRAPYFFALFRKLIAREPVKPFTYSEVSPEEV